jgi:RimJ/RimL family protein N-acetyltransferase
MPALPRPEVPLTDGHVTLRAFTLDDVPAVTAACQDPEINRWTASIPWPYNEEDARSWIAGHDSLWERGESAEFAVTAPGGGRLLGSLGLSRFDWDERTTSVGYWIALPERGLGFATRALRLSLQWAFESLDLMALGLVTMVGNVASERVAEKGGFLLIEEVSDYVHPLAPKRRLHVKRWECRKAKH